MTTNRTDDFDKGLARLDRKFQAEVRALFNPRSLQVKWLNEAGEWRRIAGRDPYHRVTGKKLAREAVELAMGLRVFGIARPGNGVVDMSVTT